MASTGSTPPSNVDQLEQAGILKKQHFQDHHLQAINEMSPDEVNTLLRLHQKLGEAPPEAMQMRPNIIV